MRRLDCQHHVWKRSNPCLRLVVAIEYREDWYLEAWKEAFAGFRVMTLVEGNPGRFMLALGGIFRKRS
jgi:hypothetical protein